MIPVSWIQIVKALVVLAVIAGIVVWVHFASVRQTEGKGKGDSGAKSRS